MKPKVHFTPGDGKGWALDEDLRQTRIALRGRIRETSAAGAQIIHAPFWQNLGMVEPGILSRAFVIAHADNPPFFYVKQPEFALGQTWVDLWVARSTEALEQFQQLGLPAVHIPYTIDAGLFFPIADKKALRREFGIPEDAYVIANFHRDTEGADLKTPKFQKAPEMMVAILKRVRDAGVRVQVLLAGPRRHWIREELAREGIPFTFVGKTGITGDDFGINILSREKLNRLYNAADLHLVPSRWEGGPQSAMEAAACRIKQLCPSIGVARDILEPASIFTSAGEAARKILEDVNGGLLDATVEPQFERWKASHTTDTLVSELQKLYERLPENDSFQAKVSGASAGLLNSSLAQIAFTIKSRTRHSRAPGEVRWNHLPGRNSELDEVMEKVRFFLEDSKIGLTNRHDTNVEIAGWPIQDIKTPRRIFQWITPGFSPAEILPGATLVAPSVRDILNLRAIDIFNPAVAMAIPFSGDNESSSPLVVDHEDRLASIRVWKALAGGRPVFHPQGLAYLEQVFWGGLEYGNAENPTAKAGEIETGEFQQLCKIPSSHNAKASLIKLLSLEQCF